MDTRVMLACLVMAAWAAAAATGAAQGAGNPTNGAVVFDRCTICHSNTKGGANKLGPNLFGVVGRKAGAYPGYSYSSAMKASGIAWTPDKLNAYLAAPQQVVPGNKMPFAGIANAGQRADLVAYLATLK